MQEILPVPNMDVSIPDIIDFKKEYSEPLKYFKRRIDEFEWSLSMCENVEEIQERTRMLQCEIENNLEEIEELMDSRGIRRTKKALQTLVPIGLGSCITALGTEGIITPMQTIVADAALSISAQLFCTGDNAHIDEKKAYLLYARESGMIQPFEKRNGMHNIRRDL